MHTKTFEAFFAEIETALGADAVNRSAKKQCAAMPRTPCRAAT